MVRRRCAAATVVMVMVVSVLMYSVPWMHLPSKADDCITSAGPLAASTDVGKTSVFELRSKSWIGSWKVNTASCVTTVQDGVADQDLTLWEKLPLLRQSKNPCWWENGTKGNHSELSCLPYFLLAGVSKCGSTDIFNRLNRHPHVVNPSRKEPSWFDWRRFAAGDQFPFQWYVSTFQTAATAITTDLATDGRSCKVVGDGSPTYFWRNFHWKQYPENAGCLEPQVVNPDIIHRLLPHAKILFSFRNPADSLYSKYLSLADKGYVQSPQQFHNAVLTEIQHYQLCFSLHSVRTCAYNISLSSPAQVRLEKGLYAVFLADWLRVFPRQQIHIIRFEDYVRDIPHHLQGMFTFLELEPVSERKLQEIASLAAANTGQHYSVGHMMPETRTLLNNFYSAFNHRLADMLNDKAFLWL